ncbi:hypothetical protein [Rhodothermus profundi]|uniref:hypothetical protein n=1 Tax=Rhodothermus profundi TaxID=633813 RepID=UPI0015BF0B64|nr:hypothetical protein [Rhodothermus profundi]
MIKIVMKISDYDENMVAILMSGVGIAGEMCALKLWIGVNKRLNVNKGEKTIIVGLFASYAAILLAMPVIIIQLFRDPFMEIASFIYLILILAVLFFGVFWTISLKYASTAAEGP